MTEEAPNGHYDRNKDVAAPAGRPVGESVDDELRVTEEAAPDEGSEAAADRVEEELDELAAAKRERDDYLSLAQRTKADFENYRKRVARESEQAAARARRELVAELLPAIDNLERALESAQGGGAGPGRAAEEPALIDGVELVHRELRSVLERAGVESYDPAGEKFDPNWHEAVETRSEDGKESGLVIETVDKGYRQDGQVLRAARVVVSA